MALGASTADALPLDDVPMLVKVFTFACARSGGSDIVARLSANRSYAADLSS